MSKQLENLDTITFEQMPKGMQHITDEKRHGRSPLFFILIVIVLALFGAFYWYSKTHPDTKPVEQTSPTLLQSSLPDFSSLEAAVQNTTIPDYSSLF